MSFKMRSLVCNKIVQVISGFPIGGRGMKPSQLLPYVKICPQNTSMIEYELDLRKEKLCESRSRKSPPKELLSLDASRLVKEIQVDDSVTGVYCQDKSGPKVKLKVCNRKMTREVLSLVCRRPEDFWRSSALLSLAPKQRVVVEFSSPNIAKPFHMGHLRSTLLGSFLSNLLQALGHEVVKINYLGDWGTQFGLLKYGYDQKQMSESDLEKEPIKALYRLYVWANAEAEKCESVNTEAKHIFNLMEKGDSKHLDTWRLFRNLSIEEFKKTYARLNVNYDHYHGESMYNLDASNDVLRRMEEKGVLTSLPDGRKVHQWEDDPPVTIVKSDGSTMYLTRDIAAAIHRFDTFQFDKMFYVVDNSQHDHFKALTRILEDLDSGLARRLEHVKFGRVRGMSTRKGTAVFLGDVLDEARDLMAEKQDQSPTTDLDESRTRLEVADAVGVSAIIVAGLKRRRMKDYEFTWESALQSNGETGVRLQYAHCRLVQLERNCGVARTGEATLESLAEEPRAVSVVRQIARFDEVLLQSYDELEPCTLVNYLLDLSRCINGAFKVLPVKGSPAAAAQDRLELFLAARHTLAAGMRILGLEPLYQM